MFSLFVTIFLLTILAGGIVGLIRVTGTQKLLTRYSSRSSSAAPTWRRETGGVIIELGSQRWELYPTQAVVGRRLLPMAAYAVTTQRTNSELSDHHQITVLGIQTDGNELVLIQETTTARSSWGPLIRAIQSIKVETDHDPGTEADIPESLRALTRQE